MAAYPVGRLPAVITHSFESMVIAAVPGLCSSMYWLSVACCPSTIESPHNFVDDQSTSGVCVRCKHHRSLYQSGMSFPVLQLILRFCVIVSAAGSRGDVCVSQIERAAVTEEVIPDRLPGTAIQAPWYCKVSWLQHPSPSPRVSQEKQRYRLYLNQQ